ncbi:helix-turn-helix domain-containing protein [Streptomyces sp. PU-14G]|uniref:helix-turn-helix domain-containing protein n=1 Tax=Streptomyces sp. PU-14G TaxID=2800808 RepID=UPI0034DF26B5
MQTEQETETGAYFMSAARAFALLAALAELEREDPGAHRLGVIARRAGLSPSQANKLLAQAEEHGLVRRTGYGRYALSPNAATTGATATRPAAVAAVAPAVRGAKAQGSEPGPLAARARPRAVPSVAGAAPVRKALPAAGQRPVTVPAR